MSITASAAENMATGYLFLARRFASLLTPSVKQAAWRAACSTFVDFERVLPAGPLMILLAASFAALVRAATGSTTCSCTLGAGCLPGVLVCTLNPASGTLGADYLTALVSCTLGVGRVAGSLVCTLGAVCSCATGGATDCLARRGDRRSSARAMSGVITTLSIDSGG